jgi:hypothetical protein
MIQPLKNRIEDGVKEKGEWAYHDHDFKSHDEKDDYTSHQFKSYLTNIRLWKVGKKRRQRHNDPAL